MSLSADDPVGQARVAAFRASMEQLGQIGGRKVRFDLRWSKPADATLMQAYAAELGGLTLDAILANASTSLAPLLQVTHPVPGLQPNNSCERQILTRDANGWRHAGTTQEASLNPR